jgi:hypothetical protein
MKKLKHMGICMDHSSALLMELTNDTILQNSVASEFTHQIKEFSLSKNENLMHNKEQHQQLSYYKKIGNSIKNFEEVVLFGPTDAKDELYNILKADHLFENVKIEVRHSDKMTINQMHSFVREYFSEK